MSGNSGTRKGYCHDRLGTSATNLMDWLMTSLSQIAKHFSHQRASTLLRIPLRWPPSFNQARTNKPQFGSETHYQLGTYETLKKTYAHNLRNYFALFIARSLCRQPARCVAFAEFGCYQCLQCRCLRQWDFRRGRQSRHDRHLD